MPDAGGGDGTWGQLHDAYFLAEGDKGRLTGIFTESEKEYGKPVFGGQGEKLEPISDKAVPATAIEALKTLPASQGD